MFEWVAVALVVVMSSARLTRLVTFDSFPPVQWVREKFIEFMDSRAATRGWAMLGYCPWCASFWVTLAVVLSGYFSDWHTAWWLINGSLGASYLAATYMAHDGDDEDEN